MLRVEVGFSSGHQSLKSIFGIVERDVGQLAVFQRALVAKEIVKRVVNKGDV